MLVHDTIRCADRAVVRDAVFGGAVANLENAQAKSEVSEKSGLEGWHEDDDMGLVDANIE